MSNSAFILNPGKVNELRLPNFKTDEGVQQFLKMLMQAAAIGEDARWYIGMCGLSNTKATTLATLSGEPSATNGYARKELERDTVDWPTANISVVNGIYRIRSISVNFAASGGDFSTSISRFFLCNDLAGTTGTLFAISSQLPTPLSLTDGNDVDVAYEIAID